MFHNQRQHLRLQLEQAHIGTHSPKSQVTLNHILAIAEGRFSMNDATETQAGNLPMLWHCVVAAACTAMWFLALILSIVIVILLLPESLRESPLIALIPIVLFLGLTFLATLAASIISSKRTAVRDPRRVT